MILVIAGSAIMGLEPSAVEMSWGWQTPGADYPRNASATGIANAPALPPDFALGRFSWVAGALVRLPDEPPPPPAVPQTITPLQARRALRAAGLLHAVSTWIAAQPDHVQEAWEYCVEVRRDNALIAGAQAALGLTEAQIDALFRSAAEIMA